MGVKIENGYLIIIEEQGGSRGTTYYYLNVDGELEHISMFFHGKQIYKSRSGRRKTYEYRITLNTLRSRFDDEVEIYEFSFSNSGYGPYCRVYKVNCVSGDISKERGLDKFPDFKVRVASSERHWLDLYDELVPMMIQRVKEIQQALGIELFFAEKSVRLEDIYNNPINAKNIALIFPQPQARSRALQGYIQSAHELYVLMLVAEALGGKTVYHVYEKPTWWLAHSQDYPTAVLESNGKKFTIWYQFTAKDWVSVVFSGLVRAYLDPGRLEKLAIEGRFNELEKVLGVRPKDTREAYTLIANFKKQVEKRQHVKPDIIIFEGDYRSRDDLERNPPCGIILIDAKINISDSDLKQLKGYTNLFNRKFKGSKIYYIIACLEKTKHRQTLEKLGFTVVEDVAPNMEGEKKFINKIRNIKTLIL